MEIAAFFFGAARPRADTAVCAAGFLALKLRGHPPMRSPSLALRLVRRSVPRLLITSLSIGLPLDVAAQDSAPPGPIAPDAAPAPLPTAMEAPFADDGVGVGLAVVGGLVSAGGIGVSGFGYASFLFFGGPLDYEYQRTPKKSCCDIEHVILVPGFLAMAGGGVLLGYGIDRVRSNGWTAADAERSVRDSLRGLRISGALLGTASALYIVAAALQVASWNAARERPSWPGGLSGSAERMLSSSMLSMGISLFMAFPTGVSTGVYLNRYMRDRFLLSRRSAGGMPAPVALMFAPTISRETYGLQVAGRF